MQAHTSCISSGLVSNAAPIPPLIEKAFGQPMLISIAATSLHLVRMKNYDYREDANQHMFTKLIDDLIK
jgi:hypothetical protein